MAKTSLPDKLINSYRSAQYQTGTGPDAIVLCVDRYSEALSQLFSASGHRCAVFITACNPLGMQQSFDKNQAASERLYRRLSQLLRPEDIIGGTGLDPSGLWIGEKSFLVLGLDRARSRMLGGEFQQNAIVWAGADAIPRLILLR